MDKSMKTEIQKEMGRAYAVLALHLSIGEGELYSIYLRMWRALGPIGLTGFACVQAS